MRDDLLFNEDNFFVSKTLKQIDSNVGYKKENQAKLVKNLQDSNKEKNKDILQKNKQIHLEIIKKRALKLEEMKRRENSRNNVHQLNIISSPYNLQFLPKISPFIQSVDNLLVIDSKKAEKVGSKGFQYIWKQEKLLKLANIKPEDITLDKKTKNLNKHKTHMHAHSQNHNLHNVDKDDIFDSNYNERKKVCDEVIILKERLNRILNQNKKVNTKFNLHKALALKFRVKKIYHPKYESIEKHKPDIILNTKTKRIFPFNLMQKSYYIDKDIMSNTTIHKYKEKQIRNISREKRNSHYICSSLSLNNLFSISLKNKANMKISSFSLDESNNINILNQSMNQKKNYNIISLKKTKSHYNIYKN